MKIFNFNRNKNYKIIPLRTKNSDWGKNKYLPSFSNEWKNTTYSYNKEELKNLPIYNLHINKLIKAYFNLYFKDSKFLDKTKDIFIKKRRIFLKKIYVSDAEIKHTANKAIITLYTFDKEKKVLRNIYTKVNKKIKNNLLRKYLNYYKGNIQNLFVVFKQSYLINYTNKKILFLHLKLNTLKKFLLIKNLYSKKVLSAFIYKYYKSNLKFLRKYDLRYSIIENKFTKNTFLPKLTFFLEEILGKKIEYNIINVKSITYNPDLFIDALTLKLRKKRIRTHSILSSLLYRVRLPIVNTIKERTYVKRNKDINLFVNKYKDLKVISNIYGKNLDNLLKEMNNYKFKLNKNIHNFIFNSIGYKNLGGMRLKLDGRLTKRYRADRSVHLLRWKGGLKNIDSSFQRLSAVLFRGNLESNNAYSWAKSKRRVGSFAVKGWISGK